MKLVWKACDNSVRLAGNLLEAYSIVLIHCPMTEHVYLARLDRLAHSISRERDREREHCHGNVATN